MVLDTAGRARAQDGRSGAAWPLTLRVDSSARRCVADREVVVTLSSPGLAKPTREPGHPAYVRAQVAVARAIELQQQTRRALAQAQAVKQTIADARRQRRYCPAGRDLLQRSQYARLLARLETMPVIEQAKGIIMAQSRCGEAEAFDLLCKASQRSNVPVRDLGARIGAMAA